MAEMKEIISKFDQIINDRTVPKNIRKVVENSKNALNNEKDPLELRIGTAIHFLDEVINDPNMPMYTRTQIWNIVSMLEELRKENI